MWPWTLRRSCGRSWQGTSRSPCDFKTLGGDPAPNIVKELVVDFIYDGRAGTARANDFHVLRLPGQTAPAPGKAAPLFRKEFDLAAAPASARITVHSLNYFEVYINGSKVGQDAPTPAVANPQHQSFTVTYEIGRHLRPGRNCVGLWVGEGWADGIAVRAQLDAAVAGKPVTIGTDTSWQTARAACTESAAASGNDFGGERVDARELTPNWSSPGLDTASWAPAVPAKAPRCAGPFAARPSTDWQADPRRGCYRPRSRPIRDRFRKGADRAGSG